MTKPTRTERPQGGNGVPISQTMLLPPPVFCVSHSLNHPSPPAAAWWLWQSGGRMVDWLFHRNGAKASRADGGGGDYT